MLEWLQSWKRYPISEIKNAQHLERARAKDPSEFITHQHPQKTSDWSILKVVGNAVFWGKVNSYYIRQRYFYTTDKKGIETALVDLPEPHQQHWEQTAKTIISNYFDQFDGQLVRLQKLVVVEVEITEEGHYCWRYDTEIEVQSTGLNAPVRQEVRQFELLLSGQTFEELALKELR